MGAPLTVAVTGLNATDNPGPGVAVIRSLRASPDFSGRIVGLAYDALEPGIYAHDLVDDVFLIPYPSQGLDALRERLEYVHAKEHLDVVIPTLDAELPAFVDLAPTLHDWGIGTMLPTREQLDLRSKARLTALESKGIPVPASKVLSDVGQLYSIHESLTYPIVVKGPYYGAKVAHTLDEAIAGFHKMVAEWGYPVIVQQFVAGEEVCVVAVGDGEGGLVGAVSMRKTVITDKGKGWAGVAIRDAGLDAPDGDLHEGDEVARAVRARGDPRRARRLPRARGEPALPRVVLPVRRRGDEPALRRRRARRRAGPSRP